MAGETMSDREKKKDFGPVDQVREKSGIYKLGFERESFLGLILPGALVTAIGGVLGIYIWKFL